MRIAEYKQTGTEEITSTVMVDDYDQDGNIIGSHEETVRKVVPVMSMVYRDMTPAEEAEALAQQAEMEEYERTRPRTVEEKLEATKSDVDMLADTVLALCDILEGE